MKTSAEDKLKSFLTTNRPTAPSAPDREFNAILAKIDADGSKRRLFSSWWHIAIPVTVAACLTLFVVSDFYSRPETMPVPFDDVALETFLYESYAVIDNGNSELMVGHNWLHLTLL